MAACSNGKASLALRVYRSPQSCAPVATFSNSVSTSSSLPCCTIAPRQHGIDMQIVPDILRIVLPRFVVRHGASSHHLEIRKPGKRVGDLLGDTFPEVIHFGVFARIRKGQYSDYRIDRCRIESAEVQGTPRQKRCTDRIDAAATATTSHSLRRECACVPAPVSCRGLGALRVPPLQPLQISAVNLSEAAGALVAQIPVFLQALIGDLFELRGTSGFSRTAGVGVPSRMVLKMTPVFSPWKASSLSPSRREQHQMGIGLCANPVLSARTCSGDMYATVPSALPGPVRYSSDSTVAALRAALSALSITFANPKSRTSACPRLVTKRC